MSKLLPAIAGAIVVGAAAMMIKAEIDVEDCSEKGEERCVGGPQQDHKEAPIYS